PRSTAYLLGSIHVLKAENYPLPVPIEAAFSNAQIAVFETDMSKLEQPETQQSIMLKAQLPEGQTLRQQLSTNLYSRFSQQVEDLGLPGTVFDQLKPSVAAMTLEVLALQKLGFDPEYGIDRHFFNRARKAGKQIVPLESVDFQIDLITQFSREEGELLMKTTLDDLDNTRKVFGDLLKAWQIGDTAKLQDLLHDAMRETPTLAKRLVTDRNERWVPKIDQLLQQDKNAIIIVGAGHVVGTNGVVALLKKKGLKVTQQ
ncbi:MAG TPA: TraB/GumN family protein, partial [Bacillota bacterium]|nr:TraB/GumN family protein [Bacillota bacterium]